ncbi:MAG: hypothetical protein P8X74_19270 [Reinekea sp.]
MLPKNWGEPMGAPAIFEKQIEIRLLHPASTLGSRIQVIEKMVSVFLRLESFATQLKPENVANVLVSASFPVLGRRTLFGQAGLRTLVPVFELMAWLEQKKGTNTVNRLFISTTVVLTAYARCLECPIIECSIRWLSDCSSNIPHHLLP